MPSQLLPPIECTRDEEGSGQQSTPRRKVGPSKRPPATWGRKITAVDVTHVKPEGGKRRTAGDYCFSLHRVSLKSNCSSDRGVEVTEPTLFLYLTFLTLPRARTCPIRGSTTAPSTFGPAPHMSLLPWKTAKACLSAHIANVSVLSLTRTPGLLIFQPSG